MRNHIAISRTFLVAACCLAPLHAAAAADTEPLRLPAPQTGIGKPLMQALAQRRTTRTFRNDRLSPQQLSNLLWAAFGVNRPQSGGRTAPSAHDAQEITIYVVMEEGAFQYDAGANMLRLVRQSDVRALTGLQPLARDAPVSLVYVADFSKFPRDSEEDRKFYSAADAGHISQNVYLFCASEGLATMVRAYIDKPALAQALRLRSNQRVVLAQSVGYPK